MVFDHGYHAWGGSSGTKPVISHNSHVYVSFAADPSENRVLEDADLQSISQNLARKPNVESLSLHGNIMSHGALYVLCQVITCSTNRFRYLDLSMCNLGDDMAASIVEAAVAQRAKKLTFLDLSCNHITSNGAKKMAEVMHNAHLINDPPYPLKKIVLRFNPIDAQGFHALVRTPYLREIDLRHCRIQVNNDVDYRYMLQGLVGAKTVRQVLLDGNHIDSEALERLEAILEKIKAKNPHSMEVSFGEGYGELRRLQQYISHNERSTGWRVYPKDLVDELKVVDGDLLIVRGRLRDMAPDRAASASQRSRGRRATPLRRVEGVEVSTNPAQRCSTPRLISPNIHSSPSEVTHTSLMQCEACPSIRSERTYPTSAREVRPRAFTTSLSAYKPPSQVEVIHHYRIAHPREEDQPGYKPRRTTSADSEVAANKIRSLVELALASDDQCSRILGANSVHSDKLMRANCGVFDMPDALLPYTVLPSMMSNGADRHKHVAKLLWLIGHMNPSRLLRRSGLMTDIPPPLRNAPQSEITHYRCARNVCIRDANKFLHETLGKGLLSSRSSSRR